MVDSPDIEPSLKKLKKIAPAPTPLGKPASFSVTRNSEMDFEMEGFSNVEDTESTPGKKHSLLPKTPSSNKQKMSPAISTSAPSKARERGKKKEKGGSATQTVHHSTAAQNANGELVGDTPRPSKLVTPTKNAASTASTPSHPSKPLASPIPSTTKFGGLPPDDSYSSSEEDSNENESDD